MSMRSPYQTLFIMSFSFNRCINAWRRKLWGMHLVCIKYELMYSDAKSKDRFISATLSSAVRTLGWGEGHVVVLMVAWSWFGQCTNLLTASWGSESPFSSTLSIHESKESWGKKKTNPLVLPVGHKHLSIPAISTCSLTLWKTSFISVREQLPKDNYALPSLYVSLSQSQFFSLCAFLPYLLDGHPKEKTDEIFPLLY